jgi:hypothetical protein
MAAWNGMQWIAGGSGTNTMAYSADGQTWVGLGSVVFGASGNAAAWNGSIWVAVGQCVTNTITYSSNGINWIGLGTTILGTGYAVAWNGTQWVAGGSYTAVTAPNALAYSSNGTTWTGSGTATFTQCNGITWGNNVWVAVGSGTYTMAYSTNGTSWTGITSVFSTAGYGITWNGVRFVAVGTGAYTIMTSLNGTTWANVTTGTSLFTTGYSVCWNQTRFVATGSGNRFAYSPDGLNWYIGDQPAPYIYLPFQNSTKDVMGVSTLTVSGTGITYITGKVGQYAINFNNIVYNTGNFIVGTYTFPTNFTVSGWFNSTNTAYATGQQVIFSTNGGNILFYILSGSLYYYTVTAGNFASIAVSSNTWYYFMITYQASGTTALYLNNVLIGSYNNTSANGTTSNKFSIGSYDNSNGTSNFLGYMDDYRIYNYALTAPFVTQPLFTAGYGVASNPRIGAVIVDSQLSLNQTGNGLNSKLDVVSDSYFQNTYKEFTANITSHAF